MKLFISNFFSGDVRIRAAVLLALFLIVFWWGLGKLIIRLASVIPYLLRAVFKGGYLLVEVPVCWIHERAGSFFHGIDNGMADRGSKIDAFLGRWYRCWRNPEKRHIVISLIIYCLLIVWICIPYNLDKPDVKAVSGQAVYLKLESKLTGWLEKHGLYAERMAETVVYEEAEPAEAEDITESVLMEVITKNDPLSVRNIPSMKNCEILESVERESTVVWKGEIAFGDGSDGDVEPWIRVETPGGTIGWARLIYLCPVNEGDLELQLLFR